MVSVHILVQKWTKSSLIPSSIDCFSKEIQVNVAYIGCLCIKIKNYFFISWFSLKPMASIYEIIHYGPIMKHHVESFAMVQIYYVCDIPLIYWTNSNTTNKGDKCSKCGYVNFSMPVKALAGMLLVISLKWLCHFKTSNWSMVF